MRKLESNLRGLLRGILASNPDMPEETQAFFFALVATIDNMVKRHAWLEEQMGVLEEMDATGYVNAANELLPYEAWLKVAKVKAETPIKSKAVSDCPCSMCTAIRKAEAAKAQDKPTPATDAKGQPATYVAIGMIPNLAFAGLSPSILYAGPDKDYCFYVACYADRDTYQSVKVIQMYGAKGGQVWSVRG